MEQNVLPYCSDMACPTCVSGEWKPAEVATEGMALADCPLCISRFRKRKPDESDSTSPQHAGELDWNGKLYKNVGLVGICKACSAVGRDGKSFAGTRKWHPLYCSKNKILQEYSEKFPHSKKQMQVAGSKKLGEAHLTHCNQPMTAWSLSDFFNVPLDCLVVTCSTCEGFWLRVPTHHPSSMNGICGLKLILVADTPVLYCSKPDHWHSYKNNSIKRTMSEGGGGGGGGGCSSSSSSIVPRVMPSLSLTTPLLSNYSSSSSSTTTTTANNNNNANNNNITLFSSPHNVTAIATGSVSSSTILQLNRMQQQQQQALRQQQQQQQHDEDTAAAASSRQNSRVVRFSVPSRPITVGGIIAALEKGTFRDAQGNLLSHDQEISSGMSWHYVPPMLDRNTINLIVETVPYAEVGYEISEIMTHDSADAAALTALVNTATDAITTNTTTTENTTTTTTTATTENASGNVLTSIPNSSSVDIDACTRALQQAAEKSRTLQQQQQRQQSQQSQQATTAPIISTGQNLTTTTGAADSADNNARKTRQKVSHF